MQLVLLFFFFRSILGDSMTASRCLPEVDTWAKCCEQILRNQSLHDSSHDVFHCRRVWRLCKVIADAEYPNVDWLVLVVAAYLHDICDQPKNSQKRATASQQSADRAVELLRAYEFPVGSLPAIHHAIQSHSFSAKILAKSDEARILQDADRIEALGAIGLARVFAIGALMGAKLFDPNDPMAESRGLDDHAYSLDHFQTKLLKLPDLMNTKTGAIIAQRRAQYLREYVKELLHELSIEK
jgi:uncharacterized protein